MIDLSILDGCPLFYELYDKEINRIVEHTDVYRFEEGQAIVEEGAEGSEIFVILEGHADVCKLCPDGNQKILATLDKGAVFGEMILIDEKVRAASVVANGRCHALSIQFQAILDLYDRYPKIFGILILNLSRLVAQRLRGANEVIRQLRNVG